ncbi:MAG: hypothetical protein ABI626_08380 [Sphingomicrobium sp.]
MLAPVALLAFIGAVLTDWAYARSATIDFSNASAWLLLAGLFAAGMVIVLLALSFAGGWLRLETRWIGLGLFVLGFIVEVFNFMIHNRDGWTTVVPTGFTLSIIGAIVMIAAAWFSRTPLSDGQAS